MYVTDPVGEVEVNVEDQAKALVIVRCPHKERRVIAVPIPATSASRLVYTGSVRLAGWSLRESTGSAAATVNIISGADTTGSMVASIALAAGASSTQEVTDTGLDCPGGIFLQVVSGSVLGSVWVIPEGPAT